MYTPVNPSFKKDYPYIIIVQVIVISFGVIEPILGFLKIEYRLNRRWRGGGGREGGGGVGGLRMQPRKLQSCL